MRYAVRYNTIHTTDTGRYIIADTIPDTDVDTSLIRTQSLFLLSSLCILQSDTELKGADFVSACIGTVSGRIRVYRVAHDTP